MPRPVPETRSIAGALEQTLSGSPAEPSRTRTLISESWRRALSRGVNPDHARPAAGRLAEIERRREGSGLLDVMPVLRETLLPSYDPQAHIMLVCDPDGVVLWREGSRPVIRKADSTDLVQGMQWREHEVGTNGLGLSLVARKPVLVHHSEHFARSLHWWSCAAAPVQDPRSGRLLGVVDLSGPHQTMGPTALALVAAAAKVAEGELRQRHWATVNRLRATASPLLARLPGQALAVDPHGWVAAAVGLAPPERVALPKDAAAGTVWLPALGMCALEPLPGGWLVQPQAREGPPAPGRVVLDLRRAAAPAVTVYGASGDWSRELSPRHAELLYVLAVRPEGLTAAQLAAQLFADPTRTVTVRAELSRLRRTFGTVVDTRPYRFSDGVQVELVLPERPDDLLPHSVAPVVLAARRG
ncbi:GAF domain-containing protein [Streptomyces smaragdinus]|uniref:GAF domain-containing protein n=1 Tax=Streptomyces smaragdinus TaxID=2585196 RepID=UPI0018865964|nr:GAF domain-containing protein [Streptomyces smaragdinus]